MLLYESNKKYQFNPTKYKQKIKATIHLLYGSIPCQIHQFKGLVTW